MIWSCRMGRIGGFMLATESLAEIVPVTIRGSRRVLVPKTYHVRGGEVEVKLGEPVSTVGFSPAEIAVRIREEIVRTFERGVGGPSDCPIQEAAAMRRCTSSRPDGGPDAK